MARGLQMTQVEIPLRGQDRLTDAPHVGDGKLLRAENVTFRNPRALLKRNGFDKVVNTLYGDVTPIGTPVRCIPHRKEKMVATEFGLFTYDSTISNWALKAGRVPRFNVDRQPLARPTGNGSDVDRRPRGCAYANNKVCVVYSKSDAGGSIINFGYIIWDETTNEIITNSLINATFGGGTSLVDCVGAGNNIWIFYTTSGGSFDRITFDTTTGTVTTSTAFLSNVSTSWDVAPVLTSTDFVIGYKDTSSGDLTIKRFNSAGTLQDTGTETEAGSPLGLQVYSAAGADAYIAYYLTGSATKIVSWPANDFTSSNFAPTNIDASNPATAGIQFAQTSSTSKVAVGYAYDDSGVTKWKAGTVTDAAVLDFANPISWLRPAGHGFLHDSRSILPVVYTRDSTAAAYYLYEVTDASGSTADDSSSDPEFILQGTLGRGFAAAGGNAVCARSGSEDKWYLPLSIITARETEDDATAAWTTEYGIDLATIDAETIQRFGTAPWGDTMVMAGAQGCRYDGEGIYDDGHTMRPVHDTAPSLQSGGSLTNATEYKYILVWEWSGADGRIVRSAPSVEQVATASTPNLTLRVTVPPIVPGSRHAAKSNVQCAIYRTDPDGGNADLFYFLNRITPDMENAVTYDDDNTPSVTTEIPLYTDSGQLPNAGPPACKFVVAHGDRLFAFGCEDADTIEYTAKYRNGIAPEWKQGLHTIRVPGAGKFTCGASMDTVLVAFTESGRIFAIVGDGPDAFGGGEAFLVQEVKTPAGCINPRSVTSIADAVAFQSPKGMLKVNRGLQVTYLHPQIGRSINTDHATIVDGVHRRDFPEVMFAMSGRPEGGSGRALLYDYLTDDVAEHLYAQGVISMAETSDGVLFWTGSDGRVYIENQAAWKDDGTFVAMAVEFYMSGQNVAGWMLAYTFNHVARWKSAHGLTYQFKWDTDEDDAITSWDDTITRTEAQVTAAKHPQQIGFPRQDWRNTVLRIADTAPASDDGQGSEWVAFVMDVGIEPGFARLPEAHMA